MRCYRESEAPFKGLVYSCEHRTSYTTLRCSSCIALLANTVHQRVRYLLTGWWSTEVVDVNLGRRPHYILIQFCWFFCAMIITTNENNTELFQCLQSIYGDQYDRVTLETLEGAIEPYLQRTRLPRVEAVQRISMNYLQDGARVKQLLSDSTGDEWQVILAQVVEFARQHALYPKDIEATSWPDLDAYEDIRRKLPSYNFEGSLDSWLTVTVVNRLRRYWRDQQALRVGGIGFAHIVELRRSVDGDLLRRAQRLSLDALTRDGFLLIDTMESTEPLIEDMVENAELRALVEQQVNAFATRKNDPLLSNIWYLAMDQQLKLREIAEQSGLSISQVHRRIQQVRDYLRENPRLREWLDVSK